MKPIRCLLIIWVAVFLLGGCIAGIDDPPVAATVVSRPGPINEVTQVIENPTRVQDQPTTPADEISSTDHATKTPSSALQNTPAIDTALLQTYVASIRDLLVFGPQLVFRDTSASNQSENIPLDQIDLESFFEMYDEVVDRKPSRGLDLYAQFVINSLAASREIRTMPLWDIYSSDFDSLVLELLNRIQNDGIGPVRDLNNFWQANLLKEFGGRGPNPFLINYDYFFSVLDESDAQLDPAAASLGVWESFINGSLDLDQEEALDSISWLKELLAAENDTVYRQLIFEEYSRLFVLLEAVRGIPIEGIDHGDILAARGRLLGRKVDLENKYYAARNLVWQETDPPPYYDQMINQLLRQHSPALNVPLCPVKGGCEIIIGRDLGAPVEYQIGGFHTGVDFKPRGNGAIIAPLYLWLIQAEGSSAFYDDNPRTGSPFGMGDHVAIGYLGEFDWEFDDAYGKHRWTGDVYAQFGHLDPSEKIVDLLKAKYGDTLPHQVLALEVAAGDELGRMGSGGFSFETHLHFELIVSWRTRDGQPTANPNPDLRIDIDGRSPGLRYVQDGIGQWYVQIGDIFSQVGGVPVSQAAKYQWPFGEDIEFIKFWETFFIVDK